MHTHSKSQPTISQLAELQGGPIGARAGEPLCAATNTQQPLLIAAAAGQGRSGQPSHVLLHTHLFSVMRATTVSLFQRNNARSATWKCWDIKHCEIL
jgi:hypothetical protein